MNTPKASLPHYQQNLDIRITKTNDHVVQVTMINHTKQVVKAWTCNYHSGKILIHLLIQQISKWKKLLTG